MSRQIEIEFSYSGNEEPALPILSQDLLADLIDARVSYASNLHLNSDIDSQILKRKTEQNIDSKWRS